MRRWAPTPSATNGDLQGEVRCFTGAGAPVDTQFAAMFARPFTYDRPHYGYVWADQPSAPAAYNPSATYSYNGANGRRSRTRSRGSRGAATRCASPASAARRARRRTSRPTGRAARHCRATGTQVSGQDALVEVACHTATGAGIDATFTLSYHEQDGMFGLPH